MARRTGALRVTARRGACAGWLAVRIRLFQGMMCVSDVFGKPAVTGTFHHSHETGKATKPSPVRRQDSDRYGTRFIR